MPDLDQLANARRFLRSFPAKVSVEILARVIAAEKNDALAKAVKAQALAYYCDRLHRLRPKIDALRPTVDRIKHPWRNRTTIFKWNRLVDEANKAGREIERLSSDADLRRFRDKHMEASHA